MLGLFLQGENVESVISWLDPVTAALERHSLPESFIVDEPSPYGVKR